MADLKISQLTASTTPLAGTEVLPIVQSGTTKQVSVANLTAGRAIAATDVTASGQLISTTNDARISLFRSAGINYFDWASGQPLAFGTQTSSGGAGRVNKVNFTDAGNIEIANGNLVIATSGKGIDFSATPGTGTSELLADYEEGTWTPAAGANLAIVGTPTYTGQYTKVGNTVTAWGSVSSTTSVAYTAGGQILSGLPFTAQGIIAVGTVIDNAFTFSSSIATLPTTGFLYGAEAMVATSAIYFQVTYHV